MLSAGLILFRLMQYGGATVLLGSSLFLLYGTAEAIQSGRKSKFAWPRGLLLASVATLLVGAVMGLVTQTGLLAGGFFEGLKIENLQIAVSQMNFGQAAAAQLLLALATLTAILLLPASRALSLSSAVAGILACSSFAWMGHGAATQGAPGYVHLAADIAHSLAAGVWIGALACFLVLTVSNVRSRNHDQALCTSLLEFSNIGSIAVTVLAISGVINGWFLIGPSHILDIYSSAYGQIFLAKLLVFTGMLLLASLNRYFLTPALERGLRNESYRDDALRRLRISVGLESAAALVLLGLVAWLGTLAPANAF